MEENSQGSHQGVGGGIESPQGNGTPGVTELPWGDENPGVTTAGAGAGSGSPREDRRGQGGYENPPTTRATEAQGDGGGDDEPMGGPRTAADDGSAGSPPRHTTDTNGARPKHSALARCEYSLLASTGAVVDPADAGDPVSEAGHWATAD